MLILLSDQSWIAHYYTANIYILRLMLSSSMLDIYHHFQQQLMSIMMGKLENDKEGSPFVNSEPFISNSETLN